MESNPNLENVEVSERPKNTTIQGQILNVIKGTRQELYDLDDDHEPKYGSLDDERLQLEIEVEYQGSTITVYEDMSFYENPSDRSMFGQFINRYGTPQTDLEVEVTFDHEGNAQVVGIRD